MPTLIPMLTGREFMIAAEHYLSASAGARIFARGGNAIDAAIAAAFVEGVVNPHMHTIGGEAPMMIHAAADGRVVSVNGNTAAPARATIAHFRSLGLKLIPGEGLLAAGVPAAFDAFVSALGRFGEKSLADVLEPALSLCEDGFPMHPGLAGESGADGAMTLGGSPASIGANATRFRQKYPSTAALYMPGGEVPAPGTLIKNQALARCFRRLLDAEAGARSRGREAALEAARERFYRGDIAREIVAWSEANGGLLIPEDLAGFTTRFEEPLSASYRGVAVFKCRPWSQGAVFLQQLRLLEGFDLRPMGHNSAQYVHTVVEAAKLAFADREAYYADPEFVQVPIENLLSERYAALRRALIDPARASLEQRPGDPIAMRALRADAAAPQSWGHGTTEVVAGDRAGNLITIIASGGWIPSSPVIESLGFPLGSRIQTFYLDESHPNALAPRKRPRTTLTPSLAARDGAPWMAFGTPGGDAQDQWSLQFFLNVVEFGMNIQEAIEAPKFSSAHFPATFYPHGAAPGVLRVEERIEADVRDELTGRGHKLALRPPWAEGYLLAVEMDRARGVLRAGADPRGQLAGVMPAQAIGW